jgi:hypothetical protein
MNEESLNRYEAAKQRLFQLNSELTRLDRQWREGLEEESSFVGRLEKVLTETYEVIVTMREIVRRGRERQMRLPLLFDKRSS